MTSTGLSNKEESGKVRPWKMERLSRAHTGSGAGVAKTNRELPVWWYSLIQKQSWCPKKKYYKTKAVWIKKSTLPFHTHTQKKKKKKKTGTKTAQKVPARGTQELTQGFQPLPQRCLYMRQIPAMEPDYAATSEVGSRTGRPSTARCQIQVTAPRKGCWAQKQQVFPISQVRKRVSVLMWLVWVGSLCRFQERETVSGVITWLRKPESQPASQRLEQLWVTALARATREQLRSPGGPQLHTPRSTITATQHLWVLACPSAVPTPLCLITHSSCSFVAPTHPSLLLTQGFNLELSFCVSLLLPLMPTLILSPCLRFKFCRRKDLNCSVGPQDPYG